MNILQCTLCNSSFEIKVNKNGFGVASCKEHTYPVINRIFYLVNNNRARRSLQLIKSRKFFLAKLALIDLPKKQSFPYFFLLNSPLKLRFDVFIKLISILGYHKGWSEYLINRKSRLSFKINRQVSKKLSKRGNTLDLGCGIGQLIPEITKKVGASNVYSADSSFMNLLIAEKYFATKGETLVCCNLESGFPFKNSSIVNLYATDTFHYIKDKQKFLKESGRVIEKEGMIFLLQIINSRIKVFGNILGIRPSVLINSMKKYKFKNINLESNDHLLKLLTHKRLNKNIKPSEKIQDLDEYSVFAQKN